MNFRHIKKKLPALLILIVITTSCKITKEEDKKSGYPITAVEFTQVTLTDDFWSKRIETNRTVTIPFGFKKCEEEGRIRNFAKAGGLLEGKYEGKMPFDDSDVYKIIEGASYSLAIHPDKELEKYIDDIIEKIAAAQEDDGYICTWKTLNPATTPAHWVEPGPRWHNLGASHELYNVGHMYEAAYAHYQATGKRNFLDVALKNADLIAETFGPGKNTDVPGHQIIETGLVKLYLATGQQKYLDLAKFFLDERGNAQGHKLHGAYSQDHKPVIEQDEAVGHAVRAVYMYAAMTDIAGIMNDSAYLNAVERIWENVVSKKLYITGGIGARHDGEKFGDNYELPNLTSYNETCAAIGNVYWNHRMFLLSGDAKYIDVLERTLYNGMISGVSLSGDSFFYPNCLESDGKYKFNKGALTRQPWFDCSCCPSNAIRFIPSVPSYVYAHKNDSLYVNLFIAGKANIKMNNKNIEISQNTNYPWDGRVIIRVSPRTRQRFAINIRIPGWAMGKVVPGDLYHYLNESREKADLKLNGKPVDVKMNKGYAVIERKWSKDDVIELNLPLPVRLVTAHKKVKDDLNKVALERGPIVYCAEWIDNDNKVLDLVIPDDAELKAEYRKNLLGGVSVITGTVSDTSGNKRKLSAIPYYAWSHRGPGEMAVWFSRKVTASAGERSGEKKSVVAEDTKVEKLAGGFRFTEGPAVDADGNIFFTDIFNNRIHKWSLDGKLSTFRENSGGANGLFFDKDGNLLACEAGGRLVSIDPNGSVTVLADKYNDKKFNSLNDLWIDPNGGVYFSDPRYGSRSNTEQDGDYVYYLSPGQDRIIRVVDDIVWPNGVIGTEDGKKLYVTDYAERKTFEYSINEDGTLSNKKLFAPEGLDGMTLDNQGNVYLTTNEGVAVYNSSGEKIETIAVPERTTNVCFGGKDRRTLFITAGKSLYSLRMRVASAGSKASF